jgi:hypothetical protein
MVDQLFEVEHLSTQGRLIRRGTPDHMLGHTAKHSFQADPSSGRSVHNGMDRFQFSLSSPPASAGGHAAIGAGTLFA